MLPYKVFFNEEGQLVVWQSSWSLATCSHALSQGCNYGEFRWKGNSCCVLYSSSPFWGESNILEKAHVVSLRLKPFRTTGVNSVFCLILRFSILNPLAYEYVMLSTVYQMIKIFMYLRFLILSRFRPWLRNVHV